MIEVNDFTSSKIDKNFLKKIAQKILAGEKKKKTELSIAFVSPQKIKELNRKYRKKDYTTDVLSYTYNNNFGEIVVCPQEVKKNAKKFTLTFKKELIRVLIHGILHFLGYDHEKSEKETKKMEEKENYYLKLCQN